jgi:hypothetical protein
MKISRARLYWEGPTIEPAREQLSIIKRVGKASQKATRRAWDIHTFISIFMRVWTSLAGSSSAKDL